RGMTDRSHGVAVVVGVGAGLGAALARRFAERYAVALVARAQEKLDALAAELGRAGGRALAVPADVSQADEIERAAERIRRELGEADVLLYNAAMRPFGRLMETKPSTFETTWRVNAFGAFLWSRAVVPAMLARGRGVILFTGATAGTKPFATSAAFGPAKFALRGLAQVMACDLGRGRVVVGATAEHGGAARAASVLPVMGGRDGSRDQAMSCSTSRRSVSAAEKPRTDVA